LSQYRLGTAYAGQVKEAEEYMLSARKNESEARAAKANGERLLALQELREQSEGDFYTKRDRAIETLARAVALGGDSAQKSLPELDRLYRARNNGVRSLDELISAKKTELGVR